MHPQPDPPAPGQESVWAYPRPPLLERTERQLVVIVGGEVVADTRSAYRVLETSHPPTYYLPPEDCHFELLRPAEGMSWCEWKGRARYLDVVVDGDRRERSVWTYPEPTAGFAAIADHLAFMPALMDECRVDGELAQPQPGGFYGGWITSDLCGPFKGERGTRGW